MPTCCSIGGDGEQEKGSGGRPAGSFHHACSPCFSALQEGSQNCRWEASQLSSTGTSKLCSLAGIKWQATLGSSYPGKMLAPQHVPPGPPPSRAAAALRGTALPHHITHISLP